MLTSVDVAGFSKVFSSMWGGSLYGRFEASAVFMVLLSLCNKDGIVDMTPEAIAGQTGWPIEVIHRGLAELAAPDKRSRTPDADGKRILPIEEHRDWGWKITNYKKYRDQMRSAERREYLRLAKEAERSKKSTTVNSVNNVNQCQPIAEAEAEADKRHVSRFALFWSLWPSSERKVAKKQCEKKWETLGCEAVAEDILKALEWFKCSEQWAKNGGEFIPMPMTWLNRRAWEVELPKQSTSHAEVMLEQSKQYLQDQLEHARLAREERKQRGQA
jgi:hypothetical protein